MYVSMSAVTRCEVCEKIEQNTPSSVVRVT